MNRKVEIRITLVIKGAGVGSLAFEELVWFSLWGRGLGGLSMLRDRTRPRDS